MFILKVCPNLENGFDYGAKIRLLLAKSYFFVSKFSYFCSKLPQFEPFMVVLAHFSIKNTIP
jgi:hypothetical protein